MKLLLSAALSVAATASFAASIQGCEVVDMGGYFNKADPTCQFSEVLPGSRIVPEGQELTVVGFVGSVPVFGGPSKPDGGPRNFDDGDPLTDRSYTVTDN